MCITRISRRIGFLSDICICISEASVVESELPERFYDYAYCRQQESHEQVEETQRTLSLQRRHVPIWQ